NGVEALGDTAREHDIKSGTKRVVALGVMLAVEEGAVELEQPAGPAGSTLRHLLSHAAGEDSDTREATRPLADRRMYAAAGYAWRAEIVAGAAGMDFPVYLQEGPFEPLGMNATRLEGSAGHGLIASVDDLVKFASEVLNPQIIHP